MGTGMVKVLVEARITIPTAARLTALILYLDLNNAFYSIIRHLGVDMRHSTEDLDDILRDSEDPIALQKKLLKSSWRCLACWTTRRCQSTSLLWSKKRTERRFLQSAVVLIGQCLG